jgi:hypothetical protein
MIELQIKDELITTNSLVESHQKKEGSEEEHPKST